MSDHPNKSTGAQNPLPVSKEMRDAHMRQNETPLHPVGSDDLKVPMNNLDFSNHRLQVTNLPTNATASKVNLFFPGNIGITLKMSPRTGAKAVVTFKTPQEFDKAFNNTRKLSMDGRPLVVSPKLRTIR